MKPRPYRRPPGPRRTFRPSRPAAARSLSRVARALRRWSSHVVRVVGHRLPSIAQGLRRRLPHRVPRPRSSPWTALLAGAVASALVALLIAVTGDSTEDAKAAPRSSPPAPSGRPSPPPPPSPIISTNFPDPDVIKADGAYYAYATNDGGLRVPMATARTINGPWTRLPQDALPALGNWAADGRTWAPDVSRRPDGTFLLYYTARRAGSDAQCLGVATAASPTGPFTSTDEPLICPTRRGGAIDAAAFVDSDGLRYLLYKSDGYQTGRPSALYLQRMTPDGLRAEGGPATRLLTWNRRDEPTLIEAPALVRRNGLYVLLYAGGVFFDDTYRTGYATATSITGPYKRAGYPLLSTGGFDKKIRGPGGADIFSDEAGDHLVFHGILEFLDGEHVRRGMYVIDLAWAGGRPIVRGSPARYEAEAGRLNRAEIRDTDGASAGKAAAYADHPESWVEYDVYAPSAGAYRLRVRYRAERGSAHHLTVNNGPQTTISYAKPGWRTTPELQIALRAGWNTLRLRHKSGQVDLDHVELA